MAKPIPLRADFDGPSLRRLARETQDANQARRLLALAAIYEGGSHTDAARIGSVTHQIVREWVLRFNGRGPTGLINAKAPGSPSKLNEEQRRALAEIVENGPIPAVHGVMRWRRKDLVQWIFEAFAISLDETTVGRELKALGFAKWPAPIRWPGSSLMHGGLDVIDMTTPRECAWVAAFVSHFCGPFPRGAGASEK